MQDLNKSEVLSKITPVLEKTAEELGFVLVETNFVKEGGSWSLRVYIYKQQERITLEDCQEYTKKIDSYVDELIPVAFRLEVSSPGTERKLKSEKEYKIFVGERAKVKLKKNSEIEPKTFIAVMKEYAEDGLILELEEEEKTVTVKTEEISSIKLEPKYDFKKK